MRINREELLKDLELVKPGLSAREFIEQSSCFVFRNGEVATFNDEVACRKPTNLKIKGAIQASSFLEVLQKIEDPELDVAQSAKGELEFRGKRKRFAMTRDAEVFLPLDRVEEPKGWRELPPAFITGLEMVRDCVSTDESRFLLTCIHVHPDYLEACDGMAALRYPVRLGHKRPLLVRGASVVHILGVGMSEVSLTSSWVHFRNSSGLILSCRRFQESYPSMEKALSCDGHKVVLPRGLKGAGERASIFASDQAGETAVHIVLRSGAMAVNGHGASGRYREYLPVKYKGPELSFYVVPRLLDRICTRYKEAVVSEDRLLARGGEDESWTFVASLSRGQAAESDSEGGES